MELRRWWRLVGVLLWLVTCLLLGTALWLLLWRGSPERRQRAWARLTQTWARVLLRLLGVRVTLQGTLPLSLPSPALLVANHQSYLDILICAAYWPARFVAKQEVRRWPLVGTLAQLGGTLFLDRNCTTSAVQCFYRACHALRQGATIAVFPEGTTTNGERLPQFKPFFCASAVRARVPVQPLTIALRRVNGHLPDATTQALFCWIDDDDFLSHFWRLLAVRHLEVSFVVHPLLYPSPQNQTRELAQRAQTAVQAGLGAPTAATSPSLSPAKFYPDLSQA